MKPKQCWSIAYFKNGWWTESGVWFEAKEQAQLEGSKSGKIWTIFTNIFMKPNPKRIKAGEPVHVGGKLHKFEVKDLLAATVAADKCRQSPIEALRVELAHLNKVVDDLRKK